MKRIEIAYRQGPELSLDELHEFQGELKSLSEEDFKKLRTHIIENDFSFSPHVWLDPKENKYFLLDGHQRIRVLKHLRNTEAYIIPPIPTVLVEAGSYRQAKQKLLSAVSQFGKVERQGLYEFLHDASISLVELDNSFEIPDLNIASFGEEFFHDEVKDIGVVTDPKEEWKDMPEFNQPDNMAFRQIIVNFRSQENVDEFSKLVDQNFTDKTKYIYFPQEEKNILMDKRYSDESEEDKEIDFNEP